MKLKDAIEKVLREARRPLGAEVIAERVLSEGLWQTNGKTPAATVAAQIYMSIKKGENRFVKAGKGVFMIAGAVLPPLVPKQLKPTVATKSKHGPGYVYIMTNPSFRKTWVKIG